MRLTLNFRNKGLLFIALGSVFAVLIASYAFSKKLEIDAELLQVEELTETADILKKAQMSAYNAVSELVVIFQAKSRDEAIDITHGKFLNLLTNYERVTEQYPNKKEGFRAFLSSLADSIKQPTPLKLQSLATELSSFQSELDVILKQVVQEREIYVTKYTAGLRELLVDIVTTIVLTVILLAIIVSIFFSRLAGDIKTLNFSLGRVLHSSSQPAELKLNRTDEVQQLSERIIELSERLQKREQALSLEQRQRARLEQNKALEHLTRGLVHAIGNPVTGLIGLIKNIQDNHLQKAELDKSLNVMAKSAQEIMGINEDLKLLSVRSGKEKELLDLNFILSEHLRLMTYDDNWFGVKIDFKPLNNLPVFTCSKDDVGIIIENLLENALDALRSSKKVENQLLIETVMQDATYIGFVITDNADGMSENIKSHAMDAFFSTKKEFSQGNGMGLLSCLNIVEKYGGKITINSKVDVGTSVTTLFPTYETRDTAQSFSGSHEFMSRETGII